MKDLPDKSNYATLLADIGRLYEDRVIRHGKCEDLDTLADIVTTARQNAT